MTEVRVLPQPKLLRKPKPVIPWFTEDQRAWARREYGAEIEQLYEGYYYGGRAWMDSMRNAWGFYQQAQARDLPASKQALKRERRQATMSAAGGVGKRGKPVVVQEPDIHSQARVGRSSDTIHRYDTIRRYKQEHPEASMQQIADTLGFTKAMVQRALNRR